MTEIKCRGCSLNCELDTATEQIFQDGDGTYYADCFCPYASCYVEFEDDELKKAYEEDYKMIHEVIG